MYTLLLLHLTLSPCGHIVVQVYQQLSVSLRSKYVHCPNFNAFSMLYGLRWTALRIVRTQSQRGCIACSKAGLFVCMEVAELSGGCTMIWGGSSELIASHVILQLFFPPPLCRLHKMRLARPWEQQGSGVSDCVVSHGRVYRRMVRFGSRQSPRAHVCVALREKDLVMEPPLHFLPFPLLAYGVGEARPLFLLHGRAPAHL